MAMAAETLPLIMAQANEVPQLEDDSVTRGVALVEGDVNGVSRCLR